MNDNALCRHGGGWMPAGGKGVGKATEGGNGVGGTGWGWGDRMIDRVFTCRGEWQMPLNVNEYKPVC